ncbi:DUF6931 family protein [Elioraea sp.]|uniref:DUF6931 family protein n=1 Tax=Elioraea sp. TaxID=2185103 RepID=UPI0025BA5DCF|nr:hypothetical protein [Elioraea sp.]
MNTPPRPPVKLSGAVLETVLERADLAPEAAAAAVGAPDTATALARIVKAGMMADAARFMAHALPKREAVWWACMCARATAPEAPPPDAAALVAAEAWVRKPEEEPRREAMVRAEAAGFRSPEAWAAVGAFWSGGSMAPLGQPVVPPAEHLTGVAVAGAVSLAAVRREPEKAEATLHRFIQSGLDIAAGGSGRIAPA